MHYRLRQLSYYRWLIFGVTTMGTFMATLDGSIVSVALPIIAASMGVQLSLVQWVVTAYLLTISSLLPLFGKAGDIFGRRRIYLLGFCIFTVGSLLCSISFNIWQLIGARTIQAIGASMLMSNSPAIISITFPGKDRGRALGMIGSVVALGSMTGPSLGGILIGMFNWQAIFYVNLPVGIMAFILGYLVLPKEEKHKCEAFDFIGASLFAVGMGAFLLVLSQGHDWGWTSPLIIITSAVSVILIMLFIRHEDKIKYPMIDLMLFKHWPFLAGNLAGLLSFIAMFSNNMLLPFYLHEILLMTPSEIGLAITPFPLVMAIVAPVSGYISERIGPVILTTGGLVMMFWGLLYFTMLDAQSTIWQVALGQAVIGLSCGMFQSPNNNSVLSSVPINKVGLASGVSALVRNVGMVIGVAVSVSVFETKRQTLLSEFTNCTLAQQTDIFLQAYHYALFIGACFALIGAIISFQRKRYNNLDND